MTDFDGKHGTKIGYARVPPYADDSEAQIETLVNAGCDRADVYVDRDCAAHDVRPQLDAAVAAVGAGDTFVVYRLDGPARSLSHLIELVATLLGRGARVQSIYESIDTCPLDRKCTHALLHAFLGVESSLAREQAVTQLNSARARGRNGGAKERLSAQQQARLVRSYAEGESVQALGKKFGITRATVYRYLHKHGAVANA